MKLIQTVRTRLENIPELPSGRRIDWMRFSSKGDQTFIPMCVCIHEFNGAWTAFSGVPEDIDPGKGMYGYQMRDLRTGEDDDNGIMNSDALSEADAKILFPQFAHLKYYRM
jgi:hypothetical protein